MCLADYTVACLLYHERARVGKEMLLFAPLGARKHARVRIRCRAVHTSYGKRHHDAKRP